MQCNILSECQTHVSPRRQRATVKQHPVTLSKPNIRLGRWIDFISFYKHTIAQMLNKCLLLFSANSECAHTQGFVVKLTLSKGRRKQKLERVSLTEILRTELREVRLRSSLFVSFSKISSITKYR